MMVQPGAYAVLLSLLRDHDDACDALQNSLIRIIRFLPNLRDMDSLPGWIMRLLVNQAASGHRQRSKPVIDFSQLNQKAGEETVLPLHSAPLSPRRTAEQHELQALILAAVSKIPERQKTALTLFEVEQLTIREVAEVMEITDGAVKFHLHEARKNVKSHLQELGISNALLSEGAGG